jgi:hypothetical protein
MWRGQESEIVTAHYKITLYRYGKSPSTGLTRSQLVPILDSVERVGIAQAMADLRGRFSPAATGVGELWNVPIEIHEDGVRIRNLWHQIVPKHGADRELRVFNGKDEIEHSPFNHQVSIFAGKTSIQMLRTANLRVRPPFDLEPGGEPPDVVGRSQGTITLKQGLITLVADEQTGFVRQLALGNNKLPIVQEIRQYDPRTYPGRIILPSVTVSVRYTAGERIYLVSVYHVNEANLNVEIPPEMFVVGVPGKTNVVDFRQDRDNPTSQVTAGQVTDVLAFASEEMSPLPATETDSAWRRGLFWATGFVVGAGLIFVALRLLRKSGQAASIRPSARAHGPS